MPARQVVIRTAYITLGDLLKLAGAVDTGGQAKHLIQSGAIHVNGVAETRRGRKLVPGDQVSWPGHGDWVIAAGTGRDSAEPPG